MIWLALWIFGLYCAWALCWIAKDANERMPTPDRDTEEAA